MAAGAFLWRGFDHEWLRSVLGFRLPHRISKLDNFIVDERHGADRASAVLAVGQAPGVDGNYMRPVGFASAIWSPEIAVFPALAEARWTDEMREADGVPMAESRVERTVEIDVGALPDDQVFGAVLRGFALSSRCDPAKQPPELPCNSNGMWPYRLAVEIGPARRDGATIAVPVTVDCHRGWTPMKGGLPGIEEKPLNRRLDIDLAVHLSLITGPPSALAFRAGRAVVQEGAARDPGGATTAATLAGVGGGAYPLAAVAMTGFGFELVPATSKPSHRHRGRYLGGLRFRVDAAGYDAETGVMTADHSARVWVPRTVVASDVRYRTSAALVQLAGAARVVPAVEGRGSICSSSAAEAPFFSRWKRCGRPGTGPEQIEDRVELTA